MSEENRRSTEDVFADHLRLAAQGAFEDDIARNVSSDIVVLSGRGIHRGHDGVRELARLLSEELPDGTFEYHTMLVDGELAFLEWTGRSTTATVDDGADSFIIRDGTIVGQTIHYTVHERGR